MSVEPARIEERAPAKLNLGLRVTGVRDDGYHELASLFVPLELADRLCVELAPGRPAVTLEVSQAAGVPGDVPADARNLASRAAAGFLAAAGIEAEVRIALEKHVPSPGGLGGGSSDAAAVLRALARALPGAVGPAELRRLALSLGADVPFFLGPEGAGPEPAWVTGIGERVEAVPGLPSLAVGLVHPGLVLETPRVFAEFDACEGLTGSGPRTTMRPLPGQGGVGEGSDDWRSPEWLSRRLVNDLEPAARRLAPVLGTLRKALEASGARAVGLSGSGPTLFGIFADVQAASVALVGEPVRAALSTVELSAVEAWTGAARTLGSRPAD